MIRTFINAFRGLFLLLKSERNFQIHVTAFLVVIMAGLYFGVNRLEWTLLLLTSGLVFALEGVNTALERLCDEVTLERKESIRNIKDIAAGSVLLAALIAIAVGLVIFLPYVLE